MTEEKVKPEPRYGVTPNFDPVWPNATSDVIAWFHDRDDAVAFSMKKAMAIWDLNEAVRL